MTARTDPYSYVPFFYARAGLKTMRELTDIQAVKGEELPSAIVPKELEANLQFRRTIIRWAADSRANQQTLAAACARDVIFFADVFVWALDVKRYPDCPDRPFITWDFQEEVLRDIDSAIGRRSVGIIKSRDIGGSTMPLIVFDKHFLFSRFVTLMVASRNERYVDDKDNPDSLFYKLDYMHRWLPSWMTQSLDRKKMTWKNAATGSNIIGSSTTADMGRGGRKNAVLVDEHAAWDRKESIELIGSLQHNTRCRVWASTPKGIGNGFHQIISAGNIRIHRLHWSQHPIHGAGLYTADKGKLKIVDDAYWRITTPRDILSRYPELEKKLPPSDGLAVHTYPFILDGKVRSPYYDYECMQCPIPKLIAQELDMDFIGSGSPFFDLDEIREYVRLFKRTPFVTGELTYDIGYEKIEWAPSKEGRLELWFHPDHLRRPAKDRRFVIGCDISAGTGMSNSHISVGDCRMRCKTAGFTTPHMRPERFAEYVYAVGTWFNDAFIAFEGSGVGREFGSRLRELNYPNLYYMTTSGGKKSEIPGFFPNEDSKRGLLTEYGRALNMREFTNPDETAVNECQMYEWTETQGVAHVGSAAAPDPSSAKKNHGDRVIGDALTWMLLKRTKRPDSPEIVSRNTLAYLHKAAERAEVRQGSWSPRDTPRPWCLVRG
ncbi:hypothetical protein LCGC14_0589660 [marine sediment metagenome]|uniref:Terminase large subunit gp17-like C-terminal domain-containing protein n=1 Tax=marine sediment metagenome TaxID=412755 RepID=A0A0F9RXP7_9ZZZZ